MEEEEESEGSLSKSEAVDIDDSEISAFFDPKQAEIDEQEQQVVADKLKDEKDAMRRRRNERLQRRCVAYQERLKRGE